MTAADVAGLAFGDFWFSVFCDATMLIIRCVRCVRDHAGGARRPTLLRARLLLLWTSSATKLSLTMWALCRQKAAAGATVAMTR
jgi:hypothetical protein